MKEQGGAWWEFTSHPSMTHRTPLAGRKKSKLVPHKRSTRAMVGYTVEASDETSGGVHELWIAGATWVVGGLVIKCGGHWPAGKTITIPTGKVSRISYEDSAIYLYETKSAVMEATEAMSGVSDDSGIASPWGLPLEQPFVFCANSSASCG